MAQTHFPQLFVFLAARGDAVTSFAEYDDFDRQGTWGVLPAAPDLGKAAPGLG